MPESERDRYPIDKTHQMTLRDLLNAESRLHIGEGVRIGAAVARELIRSQNEELFYRELQPENIFLEQETLEPYFASTPSAAEPGKQSPESRKNVFPYMSPEVMRGSPPDAVSHVWCLGVLLFEMIAGAPPFQQDHIGADGEIEALPPDLLSLRPETPEKLATLIYRMLDTDRDLRMQELEAVLAQLEDVLDSMEESVEAPSESQKNRSQGSVTAATISSLPFTTNPFIGREEEMAGIATMLANPQYRLLTLVGPGGIGKSRLAFQVAQEVIGSFPDGVYFVPLNPVRSPEFIVLAVGNALGFAYTHKPEPRLQLLRYLRSKELLLILDDFDQLAEGADIVTEILENAAGVKIVLTSRERLHLCIERVIEISGLSVPDESDDRSLHVSESVQLFHANARRVSSDFKLTPKESPFVVRICRLLCGVPLAIELASGWVRVLSCREIAEEMERDIGFLATTERDVPEHHRNIRTTFDLSWRLLEEEEKTALMKLSVFRGGFGRKAAEKVAGASLSILSRLVDKSLVQRDALGRYQIHRLLEQYLEEKLAESTQDEDRLQDLHAQCFAAFLDEREDSLRGEDQRSALDQIEEEIGNIHKGWKWAIDHGDLKKIDRSIVTLSSFYQVRSWLEEGGRMLRDALTKIRANPSHEYSSKETDITVERLRARLGLFDFFLGRLDDARESLKQSLAVFETNKKHTDMAFTLWGLAEVTRREGNYDESRRLCEQCLLLSREIADRWTEANVLATMGGTAAFLGEYDDANMLFQQSLSISRVHKYLRVIVKCLNGLGNVVYSQGDYLKAKEHYEEGLSVARAIGDMALIAILLGSVGNAAYVLGDYQMAKELYQERLEFAKGVGSDSGIARSLCLLGYVYQQLGEYENATKLLEDSVALSMGIGEKREAAYCMNALGEVAVDLHDYEEAKRRFVESIKSFRKMGIQRGLAISLNGLGGATLAMGEVEESAVILKEALQIAVGIQATPVALCSILESGRLLEARGDKYKAALIYAFVSSQKEIEHRNSMEAGRALADLFEHDFPGDRDAILAEGRGLTLEQVAEDLLRTE